MLTWLWNGARRQRSKLSPQESGAGGAGGAGGELKGRPKQLMCFLQAGNWAVAPLESVSLKPSRLGVGRK